MKNIVFFILICLCCMFHISPAAAASVAGNVREGNRLYDEKKYDEAVEKYNAAGEEDPDSDIVNFNLGAALYKKGRYKESVDAFTRALNTEERGLEADAVYNMANAKYKLGKAAAEKDMNSAVGMYRESLDYYKRAIELNGKNNDARYNHELVEKELKVLLDRIKNQPPPQQQDRKDQEKEEGKEEEKESRQEQSGSDADQNREEGKDQQDQQQQRADDKEGEGRSGENMDRQEASEREGETEEMSPEEARMLLDAYGDEEAMDKLNKQQRGRFPLVVKDW